MNAVSSTPKDSAKVNPDAQEPLTDNDRLRRSNPYEVSRVTCSKEAADYAYLHFPSPMTIEWRAASAGYDEGVAKGKIDGLNKASEIGNFADRMQNELQDKDHLIEGLEKGLKAAEAVIQGIWDARALGVDQKAQKRYEEARETVDWDGEENPVIPESSVVDRMATVDPGTGRCGLCGNTGGRHFQNCVYRDPNVVNPQVEAPSAVPLEDIADMPTLATGPIEPDTKQWDPESDVAWLKEQLLLLQASIRKMRSEFDERERVINEEAYRRGWQDAMSRSNPATPAWPATPFWMPQVIA